MKVKFIYATEDLVAFNTYHHKLSPRFYWRDWWGLVLVWLFFVALAIELLVQRGNPIPLILLPVGTALLVFIVVWWSRKRFDWYIQSFIDAEDEYGNKIAPEETELEISGGKIHVKTKTMESILSLELLEKVVKTPTHLFLYVSGSSAIVVPRVFVPNEELEELLEVLRAECSDLSPQEPKSEAITEYVRADLGTSKQISTTTPKYHTK